MILSLPILVSKSVRVKHRIIYIFLPALYISLTLYVLLSNVFIICYTVCFIRLVHCISLYFQGAMEFCTVIFSPVLYTYNSKPH